MSEKIVFSSTSSGPNGWSSLSGFLDCSSKATESYAKSLLGRRYDLYPEDKGAVAATVGTIFGELAQRTQSGNPVSPAAKFYWHGEADEPVCMEETHPKTCAEARRLHDHYAANMLDLGEVVAMEMPIKIPKEIFGIEITGNIDLVCRRRGGIWIDDFKTEGQEAQTLKLKFSARQQKWVYALGYELATGEKPVGCSIICVIKTKDPKIRHYEYEAVTDERFAWLKESVDRVKAGMLKPTPTPGTDTCYSYGKWCQHYQNDFCQLIKGA